MGRKYKGLGTGYGKTGRMSRENFIARQLGFKDAKERDLVKEQTFEKFPALTPKNYKFKLIKPKR